MDEQVNNKVGNGETGTELNESHSVNLSDSTEVQIGEKLYSTSKSTRRTSKLGIPISMSFSTDRNRLGLFQKLSALQKDLEQTSPEVIFLIYKRVLDQLFHIMNHDKPPPLISHLVAGCFVALHKSRDSDSFEGDPHFLHFSRQFLIRPQKNDIKMDYDLEKKDILLSTSEPKQHSSAHNRLNLALIRCYNVIGDKNVDEWGKLSAYWCICWVSAMLCFNSSISIMKQLIDVFRDNTEWLLYYLNKVVRHDIAKVEAFHGLIYFIEAYGKLFDSSQVKAMIVIFKKHLSVKHLPIRIMVAKCILSLLYYNTSSRTLNHELTSLLNTSMKSIDISGDIGESVIEMMSHLLFHINSKSPNKSFDMMMEWLQTNLWKWLSTNDDHLLVVKSRAIEFYDHYFHQLGSEWMENHFSSILLHFDHFLRQNRVTDLEDLLPSIQSSCDIIFRSLIRINSIHLKRICIHILFKEVYKCCEDVNYQQIKVHISGFLLFLLKCLRKLMDDQDGHLMRNQLDLNETIKKCLLFPVEEIQVELCHIIKELCLSSPELLPVFFYNCLSSIEKYVFHWNEENPKHLLDSTWNLNLLHLKGLIYTLSILLTIIQSMLYYLSYEISERIWNLIIRILSKLNSKVSISILQFEISWSLLSGLMCLEDLFICSHLEQIITLWRNIFMTRSPKELPSKMEHDWTFFLKARDLAMRSICVFLHRHSGLLSQELLNFIITCIHDCFLFLNEKPSNVKYDCDSFETCLLHCFAILPDEIWEKQNMINSRSLIKFISDYSFKSDLFVVFTNQMDVFIIGEGTFPYQSPSSPETKYDIFPWFSMDLAHDDRHLCTKQSTHSRINYALEIFSKLFVSQTNSFRKQLLLMLNEELCNTKLTRKVTLQINFLTAILISFSKLNRRKLTIHHEVQTIILEFLESIISHQDPYIRYAASCAYGLVSSCVSVESAGSIIDLHINRISQERELYSRSGYILSLGHIMKYMEIKYIDLYLIKIWALFQSTILDSNSVIFRSSLISIRMILEVSQANLTSLSHAVFTLITRCFLWLHFNDSSVEMTFLLIQCILAYINSLTQEELNFNSKLFQLCYSLCYYVQDSPFLIVKTINLSCLRRLTLGNTDGIQMDILLGQIMQTLKSGHRSLCHEALVFVTQLPKEFHLKLIHQPYEIQHLLVHLLYKIYDPIIIEELKNTLTQLMIHTIESYSELWFRFFLDLILRPSLNLIPRKAMSSNIHEEVTFDDTFTDTENGAQEISLSKIEPRLELETTYTYELKENILFYVLHNLKILLDQVKIETLNLSYHRIVVPDLLRSVVFIITNGSDRLKLKALSLMSSILTSIKDLPDPDDPSQILLYQYSAFVMSSFTSIFSSNHYNPLIFRATCEISVTYLLNSKWSNKNMDIHKLLTMLSQLLDRLQGDLNFADINPLAYSMIKQAILTSWADLYLASNDSNTALNEYLNRHLPFLSLFWLRILYEYAGMRFSTYLSRMNSPHIPSEHYLRSLFSKKFLFEYYDTVWIKWMSAWMKLLQASSNFPDLEWMTFDKKNKQTMKNFYVLMGLCIEDIRENKLGHEVVVETCLNTLQKLLELSFTHEKILSEEMIIEILESLNSLRLRCNGSIAVNAVGLMNSLFLHIKNQESTNHHLEYDQEALFHKLVNSSIILTLTFLDHHPNLYEFHEALVQLGLLLLNISYCRNESRLLRLSLDILSYISWTGISIKASELIVEILNSIKLEPHLNSILFQFVKDFVLQTRVYFYRKETHQSYRNLSLIIHIFIPVHILDENEIEELVKLFWNSINKGLHRNDPFLIDMATKLISNDFLPQGSIPYIFSCCVHLLYTAPKSYSQKVYSCLDVLCECICRCRGSEVLPMILVNTYIWIAMLHHPDQFYVNVEKLGTYITENLIKIYHTHDIILKNYLHEQLDKSDRKIFEKILASCKFSQISTSDNSTQKYYDPSSHTPLTLDFTQSFSENST